MKVKSESEVTQLCPTLRDPMDYSLPGSSAHGIFQARPRHHIKSRDITLPTKVCLVSSVQFSRSVVSDSLRPHEPQHARLP